MLFTNSYTEMWEKTLKIHYIILTRCDDSERQCGSRRQRWGWLGTPLTVKH